MTRTARAAAMTAAGILLLSACADDPAAPSAAADAGSGTYPVTVASCGVDHTYDSAPSRVLLGAPGAVATLDALGVADSAIGYTNGSYTFDGIDRFPGLTATTDDYAPSREFLIGASPDLFLSNDEGQLSGQGTAGPADLDAIGSNLYVLGGYCVNDPAPTTIDAVYTDVQNLGAIYGVPDRATEVVTSLRERVDRARAANTDVEPLTAAVVQSFDGKLYALSGSYYSAVVDALGMSNEFADIDGNFAEVTPEAVLSAAPDVVLVQYAGTGADADAAVADIETLLANSPAVQNSRVYPQNEADFQAGGVRIVDAIENTADNVFGR
ncbi:MULTISPECIES: ABC transporter substrate-binding protein [Nocardiaceae]|uniref:Iron complex transport system substrate-binding protein n=1 Tax=Rhodococcoides corynebacterioides TaxID=53972 RepID=A0ABS2KNA0_9NOCA|nr:MULTISPECIES: ABC transporter substrate-binding protein [Rhodococcus]MBM7413447.1 iron complex transport system substrate-binding protein [Rhodococcus corynebacterioides]MBP1115910.1 iron complex transport system substrate-binding protein [Rhodococcus sp. PvP016]